MASSAQMALLSGIMLLSVAFRAATAKEFIVGGESGWTIPSTKNGLDLKSFGDTTNFTVGDTLVFYYNPHAHSVLSVTGPAFAACNTSEPLESWADGNTKVKLEQAGRMWFICGTPSHCSKGQAFKVTVSASQSGAGNAPINASSKAVVILVSIIVGICLQVL